MAGSGGYKLKVNINLPAIIYNSLPDVKHFIENNLVEKLKTYCFRYNSRIIPCYFIRNLAFHAKYQVKISHH
jgi:hypothetical protein